MSNAHAKGIKVNLRELDGSFMRPVVAVSLGPVLKGSLLPHADSSDPQTCADGLTRRMGKPLPPYDKAFLRRFNRFVEKWMDKNGIEALPTMSDVSIDSWLEKTNYPEWRKQELRQVAEDVPDFFERDYKNRLLNFNVKTFMKDEHYIDWKAARLIYAREDVAKLVFGPFFKLAEDVIYKLPWFIKHIPVAERAQYILDNVMTPGGVYMATDYSAYERHFTKELMESCEFVLYNRLFSKIQGGSFILTIMNEVLTGRNNIQNKYFSAKIDARRMSGEMNTSLGNGFSNLMIMFFMCHELGIEEPKGVVEGDDGLFCFIGTHPRTSDFTRAGFDIKLQVYDNVYEAGFCGQLFDVETFCVLTDPYKVITMFGWTTERYKHAGNKTLLKLLRCKALSVAHQYPGCPIIGKLAQFGLRVTRSFDAKSFVNRRKDLDTFQREKLITAFAAAKDPRDLYREPQLSTRLLFEELFGIPVSTQLKCEEYLDSLRNIEELDMPLISDYVPTSWREYWTSYVVETSENAQQYHLPVFPKT